MVIDIKSMGNSCILKRLRLWLYILFDIKELYTTTQASQLITHIGRRGILPRGILRARYMEL